MWIGYSQLKHLTILLCYQVGVLVRAQNVRGAVIPGGCVPCTRAGIAAHFNIAVYTLARSFDGIYSKASEYSDACFVSRYFYVCVLCSAYGSSVQDCFSSISRLNASKLPLAVAGEELLEIDYIELHNFGFTLNEKCLYNNLNLGDA